MNPQNIKAVKVILLCLLIVCGAAKVGGIVGAQERKPSKADYQNLEDIKANQKLMLQAEEWNKAEVSELNKNGWNVKWSPNPDELEIIPLSESFQ